MDSLDKIIESLKKIVEVTSLEIGDQVIFENAIKIYLSDKISASKKENIKEFSQIKKEEVNKIESPTPKQISYLKEHKFKIEPTLTKQEATKKIKEYIDRLNKQKSNEDKNYDY
jgi:hypothetical protein